MRAHHFSLSQFFCFVLPIPILIVGKHVRTAGSWHIPIRSYYSYACLWRAWSEAFIAFSTWQEMSPEGCEALRAVKCWTNITWYVSAAFTRVRAGHSRACMKSVAMDCGRKMPVELFSARSQHLHATCYGRRLPLPYALFVPLIFFPYLSLSLVFFFFLSFSSFPYVILATA